MTADRRLNFVMDAKNVDLEHLPISDDTVDLGGKLNAKGHLSVRSQLLSLTAKSAVKR